MPAKIRRAHVKGQPRRECACGLEIKNGGKMCTFCRALFDRRRYHSEKWRNATDEEVMVEVLRLRRAEREKAQLRRTKEVNL